MSEMERLAAQQKGPVKPKVLPDDGNKYIFPAGQPAPGSNIAPAVALPAPKVEDIVNPDIPITPAAPTSTEATRLPATSLETPIAAEPPKVDFAATSKDQDALDKVMKQQDEHLKATADRAKVAEQEYAKEKIRIDGKLAEIDAKGPFKFDDRSLWAKSSTGQKIALLVGGFLSSLNKDSAASFRAGVENTLQRDLAIQNKMLDEGRADKNSLLLQLQNVTRDRRAANDLYEATIYKGLASKAQGIMQRAQSELQRKNAAATYDLAMQGYQFKRQEAEVKLAEKRGKASIVGYEGAPLDPASKKSFGDTITSAKTIKSSLEELKRVVGKFGSSVPFTKSNDTATRLVGDIQLQLKEIKKLGVLSGDDSDRLDYYISNPSLFKSDDRMLESIKGVQDLVDKAVNAQASTYGQYQIGVPRSFQKKG